MTEREDQAIRDEYADLIDDMLRGVHLTDDTVDVVAHALSRARALTSIDASTRGPGTLPHTAGIAGDPGATRGPGTLPDTASIRTLQPGTLPALLQAIRELREEPSARAEALGRLAEVSRTIDHALTCRAYALAVDAAREAGDAEASRRYAGALVQLSASESWRKYADGLLGGLIDSEIDTPRHPADCGLFRGVSQSSRDALLDAARLWRMPAGSWLCVEETEAEELWVLRSGRVAVLRRSGTRDTLLRFRGPGEVVGDMGALAPGRTRPASIVAVAPVEAWVIPYDALIPLASNPEHHEITQRLERQYFERRLETRISQHLLFQSLDRAVRAEIAAAVDRSHSPTFEPHQTLATAETPIDQVLLILDGVVEAHGPDGHLVETLRSSPDTIPILGAEALLCAARWPGNVIAASEGWAAWLPARDFATVVRNHPSIRIALAKHLLR